MTVKLRTLEEIEAGMKAEDKVTYSDSDLESKALTFLKQIRGKEYKKMSKKDINEYCRLKAKACRDYAKSLMATGEPDFIAWNRAIRLEILGSESD